MYSPIPLFWFYICYASVPYGGCALRNTSSCHTGVQVPSPVSARKNYIITIKGRKLHMNKKENVVLMTTLTMTIPNQYSWINMCIYVCCSQELVHRLSYPTPIPPSISHGPMTDRPPTPKANYPSTAASISNSSPSFKLSILSSHPPLSPRFLKRPNPNMYTEKQGAAKYRKRTKRVREARQILDHGGCMLSHGDYNKVGQSDFHIILKLISWPPLPRPIRSILPAGRGQNRPCHHRSSPGTGVHGARPHRYRCFRGRCWDCFRRSRNRGLEQGD